MCGHLKIRTSRSRSNAGQRGSVHWKIFKVSNKLLLQNSVTLTVYFISFLLLIFNQTQSVDSICVWQGGGGFRLACGFRQSGLFRLRSLGGLKGWAGAGFTVGDEDGFKDSLTNTEQKPGIQAQASQRQQQYQKIGRERQQQFQQRQQLYDKSYAESQQTLSPGLQQQNHPSLSGTRNLGGVEKRASLWNSWKWPSVSQKNQKSRMPYPPPQRMMPRPQMPTPVPYGRNPYHPVMQSAPVPPSQYQHQQNNYPPVGDLSVQRQGSPIPNFSPMPELPPIPEMEEAETQIQPQERKRPLGLPLVENSKMYGKKVLVKPRIPSRTGVSESSPPPVDLPTNLGYDTNLFPDIYFTTTGTKHLNKFANVEDDNTTEALIRNLKLKKIKVRKKGTRVKNKFDKTSPMPQASEILQMTTVKSTKPSTTSTSPSTTTTTSSTTPSTTTTTTTTKRTTTTSSEKPTEPIINRDKRPGLTHHWIRQLSNDRDLTPSNWHTPIQRPQVATIGKDPAPYHWYDPPPPFRDVPSKIEWELQPPLHREVSSNIKLNMHSPVHRHVPSKTERDMQPSVRTDPPESIRHDLISFNRKELFPAWDYDDEIIYKLNLPNKVSDNERHSSIRHENYNMHVKQSQQWQPTSTTEKIPTFFHDFSDFSPNPTVSSRKWREFYDPRYPPDHEINQDRLSILKGSVKITTTTPEPPFYKGNNYFNPINHFSKDSIHRSTVAIDVLNEDEGKFVKLDSHESENMLSKTQAYNKKFYSSHFNRSAAINNANSKLNDYYHNHNLEFRPPPTTTKMPKIEYPKPMDIDWPWENQERLDMLYHQLPKPQKLIPIKAHETYFEPYFKSSTPASDRWSGISETSILGGDIDNDESLETSNILRKKKLTVSKWDPPSFWSPQMDHFIPATDFVTNDNFKMPKFELESKKFIPTTTEEPELDLEDEPVFSSTFRYIDNDWKEYSVPDFGSSPTPVVITESQFYPSAKNNTRISPTIVPNVQSVTSDGLLLDEFEKVEMLKNSYDGIFSATGVNMRGDKKEKKSGDDNKKYNQNSDNNYEKESIGFQLHSSEKVAIKNLEDEIRQLTAEAQKLEESIHTNDKNFENEKSVPERTTEKVKDIQKPIFINRPIKTTSRPLGGGIVRVTKLKKYKKKLPSTFLPISSPSTESIIKFEVEPSIPPVRIQPPPPPDPKMFAYHIPPQSLGPPPIPPDSSHMHLNDDSLGSVNQHDNLKTEWNLYPFPLVMEQLGSTLADIQEDKHRFIQQLPTEMSYPPENFKPLSTNYSLKTPKVQINPAGLDHSIVPEHSSPTIMTNTHFQGYTTSKNVAAVDSNIPIRNTPRKPTPPITTDFKLQSPLQNKILPTGPQQSLLERQIQHSTNMPPPPQIPTSQSNPPRNILLSQRRNQVPPQRMPTAQAPILHQNPLKIDFPQHKPNEPMNRLTTDKMFSNNQHAPLQRLPEQWPTENQSPIKISFSKHKPDESKIRPVINNMIPENQHDLRHGWPDLGSTEHRNLTSMNFPPYEPDASKIRPAKDNMTPEGQYTPHQNLPDRGPMGNHSPIRIDFSQRKLDESKIRPIINNIVSESQHDLRHPLPELGPTGHENRMSMNFPPHKPDETKNRFTIGNMTPESQRAPHQHLPERGPVANPSPIKIDFAQHKPDESKIRPIINNMIPASQHDLRQRLPELGTTRHQNHTRVAFLPHEPYGPEVRPTMYNMTPGSQLAPLQNLPEQASMVNRSPIRIDFAQHNPDETKVRPINNMIPESQHALHEHFPEQRPTVHRKPTRMDFPPHELDGPKIRPTMENMTPESQLTPNQHLPERGSMKYRNPTRMGIPQYKPDEPIMRPTMDNMTPESHHALHQHLPERGNTRNHSPLRIDFVQHKPDDPKVRPTMEKFTPESQFAPIQGIPGRGTIGHRSTTRMDFPQPKPTEPQIRPTHGEMSWGPHGNFISTMEYPSNGPGRGGLPSIIRPPHLHRQAQSYLPHQPPSGMIQPVRHMIHSSSGNRRPPHAGVPFPSPQLQPPVLPSTPPTSASINFQHKGILIETKHQPPTMPRPPLPQYPTKKTLPETTKKPLTRKESLRLALETLSHARSDDIESIVNEQYGGELPGGIVKVVPNLPPHLTSTTAATTTSTTTSTTTTKRPEVKPKIKVMTLEDMASSLAPLLQNVQKVSNKNIPNTLQTQANNLEDFISNQSENYHVIDLPSEDVALLAYGKKETVNKNKNVQKNQMNEIHPSPQTFESMISDVINKAKNKKSHTETILPTQETRPVFLKQTVTTPASQKTNLQIGIQSKPTMLTNQQKYDTLKKLILLHQLDEKLEKFQNPDNFPAKENLFSQDEMQTEKLKDILNRLKVDPTKPTTTTTILKNLPFLFPSPSMKSIVGQQQQQVIQHRISPYPIPNHFSHPTSTTNNLNNPTLLALQALALERIREIQPSPQISLPQQVAPADNYVTSTTKEPPPSMDFVDLAPMFSLGHSSQQAASNVLKRIRNIYPTLPEIVETKAEDNSVPVYKEPSSLDFVDLAPILSLGGPSRRSSDEFSTFEEERPKTRILQIRNAPKSYYPSNTDMNFDPMSKQDLYTDFKCEDQKYFPGLYADSANSCKVFHLCAKTDSGFMTKTFRCPQATVFDQEILRCNWGLYVQCAGVQDKYHFNKYLSQSFQFLKTLGQFSASYNAMNGTLLTG